MRIILARHGETEENAAGIIQGHLPGTLSARGREQARLLGLRLRDDQIAHIYSSDLSRARDTAAEILRHHPDVPVTYLTGLRERYLGSWQGKRGSDVDRSVILASPEVESDREIAERAAMVIRTVRKDHTDGSVILVAHGGVNWAIIGALVGEKCRDQLQFMQNAAVSIFESPASSKGDVDVIAHNETGHLEVMT